MSSGVFIYAHENEPTVYHKLSDAHTHTKLIANFFRFALTWISNFEELKIKENRNFYYFSSRCENRAVHVNTVWQRLNSEGIFCYFSLAPLSFRVYAIRERRERLSLNFEKVNSREIYDWMLLTMTIKSAMSLLQIFFHHHNFPLLSLGVYYTLNTTTLISRYGECESCADNGKKLRIFITRFISYLRCRELWVKKKKATRLSSTVDSS